MTLIVDLQRFAESSVARITCRVAILLASCGMPAIWILGLPVVCRLGIGYWERLAVGLVYSAGVGCLWGGATLWFLATLVLGNRAALLRLLITMRTSTYSGVARNSYLRDPQTCEERFNVSRGLAVVGMIVAVFAIELLAVPWIVGFASGLAAALCMAGVAIAVIGIGVAAWFGLWMISEAIRGRRCCIYH